MHGRPVGGERPHGPGSWRVAVWWCAASARTAPAVGCHSDPAMAADAGSAVRQIAACVCVGSRVVSAGGTVGEARAEGPRSFGTGWRVAGEWAGVFPLPLTAADAREQCTGAMQRTQA